MKAFTFSLLLICLAFVSFAQGALSPPADSETTVFNMDPEVSQIVVTSDITPAVMYQTAENRIDIEAKAVTRTLEYRPDRDGYGYSTTLEMRKEDIPNITTTTAEMKYDVSDIDVGVSITKAAITQRMTPDSKQRLTPNDAGLTLQRSKQDCKLTNSYPNEYIWNPGFVGWSR